jgi:hypothetical protein
MNKKMLQQEAVRLAKIVDEAHQDMNIAKGRHDRAYEHYKAIVELEKFYG